MMFNQYPYLNLNDLNLDYILAQIKTMMNEVTNFVSINAIKYADPIQWDITRQYEKNTVVIDPVTGTAYISVAPVPAGVALTRPEYWTVVFDLGSFVTRAAKNFSNRYEAETTLTATFNTAMGEWLVWGDTLYKALVNITAGDSYVVDSNIQHITVEDVYNEYLNKIASILAIIGDLQDLTTSDTSDIVHAINSVLNDLNLTIGDLANLTTSDTSDIVNAINSVLNDLNATIGDLDNLTTSDKTSVVNAINSIKAVTPFDYILPHLSNNAGNDVTLQLLKFDDDYVAIDSSTLGYISNVHNYLAALLGTKKLKAYFITHFHGDHAAGSEDIIESFCDENTLIVFPMNVDFLQFTDGATSQNYYNQIVAKIAALGFTYTIPSDGEILSLFDNSIHVNCYNYDTNNLTAYYTSDDYNNCSASFRFASDAGALYVSGDTGIDAQALIYGMLEPVDVALIPHHNVNFCGSVDYHSVLDAKVWIAQHQVAVSSFPRYIGKVMIEYIGIKPIYDCSSDLTIRFDDSIEIIGGGNVDVINTTNNYRIMQTYPYANDLDNIIKDYTKFAEWTLDHLVLMSVKNPIKRSFILFNSSSYTHYYADIITELTNVLGGTSWIVEVGGGFLEARLYSNDNGRRILKYCSGGAVITRYCSLEEFSNNEWSTLNISGAGSTAAVHPWGQPALLGCFVTTGGGSTEVLLYNTKRGGTYHGYAKYSGNDVYVNVTISSGTLTLNACTYNGVDANLIEVGPLW